MTQRKGSQSTHTTTSLGASCVGSDGAQLPPDSNIVSDVLGHRSRYKRGFGPLPRLKAFGGQRAHNLASNSTSQVEMEKLREENKQIKQNVVAHHEYLVTQQGCMVNMMQQMQQQHEVIQQMQQQMKSVIPGFNCNMGQSMPMRMPMPPPPIFDNEATSHQSCSVQQENDNNNNVEGPTTE